MHISSNSEMPREIIDTDFYIALLSDGSDKLYPENSLSAFTNTLSRQCRLEDGLWVVGMTEFSFSAFTKNAPLRQGKNTVRAEQQDDEIEVMNVDDDADDDDDDDAATVEWQRNNGTGHDPIVVDSLECGEDTDIEEVDDDDDSDESVVEVRSNKKRKVNLKKIKIVPYKKAKNIKKREQVKASAPEVIQIKIDNNTTISLSLKDLDDMCYDVKKKDINFGKFLQVMADKITPKPKSNIELHRIKRNILDRMLALIDSKDWPNIVSKYTYVRNIKMDYLLHVYMGSTTSSNILLRTQIRYVELEDFVSDVLYQIIPNRRKINKLKELFKLFYPDYLNPDAPPAPAADDDTKMDSEDDDDDEQRIEIYLDEFGVKLVTENAHLSKKPVAVAVVLKELSENLLNLDGTEKYVNENNLSLVQKMKSTIMDIFRGGQFTVSADEEAYLRAATVDTLAVEISNKGETAIVNLPKMKYKRPDLFAKAIQMQLPVEWQSTAVVQQLLDRLFENVAPAKLTAASTLPTPTIPIYYGL